MRRIAEILSREDIMEKQRSRVDWLADGDRNSAYFQAKARGIAKQNRISCLREESNNTIFEWWAIICRYNTCTHTKD
jgi:hypothetical protein